MKVEISLKGYMENQPVRVGNQAYTHIQNDVYGQVLISLLPLYEDKRIIFTERFDSSGLIMKTLKMIEKTFEEKDAGLWEFRNLKQHHTYTFFIGRGSCAAIKMAEVLKNEEMGKLAVKLKKRSEVEIEKAYVSLKKGYAQAVGVDRMDASTPTTHHDELSPGHSQRAKNHLIAMEKELAASGGLFYRYKHQDDF